MRAIQTIPEFPHGFNVEPGTLDIRPIVRSWGPVAPVPDDPECVPGARCEFCRKLPALPE